MFNASPKYHLIISILLIAHQLSIAQFTERAFDVGIDHEFVIDDLIGGGVAVFDMNDDDLLDFFITGGEQNSALYINNGNGYDQQLLYLLSEDIDFYEYPIIGVVSGDVNNDGFNDLFLCTGKDYENLLLINNKDNLFDAIPPGESGIDEVLWSTSATFGDINKDGWIDIFVANYIQQQNVQIDDSTGEAIFLHQPFKNNLYLNQGDNSFIDISENFSLLEEGTSLACTFTDFDNDNDVDLYVVNDFGHFIEPNELYENQYPDFDFDNISVSSAANIGLFGMGIAVGDSDGDLDLDYYVTNIGRNILLRNNGDRTFTDYTQEAGVGDEWVSIGELTTGWGTGFFDYDNDGDLDLYVSNGHIPASFEIFNPMAIPNVLFENQNNIFFNNVARPMGLDLDAICRGSAYGDFDLDGDLDLIFVPVRTEPEFTDPSLRSEVAVYYNETENDNNWLSFKLNGIISNRNAFGAHVYLYDSNGKIQLREIDGGSGHASSNSPYAHFGIGNAEEVDSIIIIWPSGIIQKETNLIINQFHTIWEEVSIRTDTLVFDFYAGLIDSTICLDQFDVFLPGWNNETASVCQSGPVFEVGLNEVDLCFQIVGEINEDASDTFCVIYCDGNLCDTTIIIANVEDTSSVIQSAFSGLIKEIKVYPNPTTAIVLIDFSQIGNRAITNLAYQLHSINGEIIETKKIENYVLKLDLKRLPSGVYYLKIIDEKLNSETIKILKL